MNDIQLNLISLAFFLIAGGAAFFFVRQKRAKNEQRLGQMAAENGWTLENIREPLMWGLRLKSARWTLEALSRSSGTEAAPGSSNVSMSTDWYAAAPGSVLLIGPRTSQASLGSMGDMLTRQVLSMALGAQADGLNEVQAGSPALRQKYMLWAQQAPQMEKGLTPAVESALLNWKGSPPLIKRTSEGLRVELRGVRLQKVDELRALAQLGELLLESFQ